MPLVSSTLKQGLLSLLQTYPSTPLEAGMRWAQSYAQYASLALSPLGVPPAPLAAQQSLLGATLGGVFANVYNPAPATATSIAAALTSFWLTPPVVFPAPSPGLVTLVGGTAVLQAGLLATWASNLASRASNDQAMGNIASVIDAFSHTIIVTHIMPPPTPPVIGPLS